MDMKKDVFPRVVAYLIATALIAVATSVWSYARGKAEGEAEAQQRFTQKFEAAPEVYAGKLLGLMQEANKASSGEEMLIRSRAIVSARDELRSTLGRLSSLFNSDIDRLAMEIQDAEARQARGDPWKDGGLRGTVAVLLQKWPSKMDQIRVEVRKQLSELGLVPGK